MRFTLLFARLHQYKSKKFDERDLPQAQQTVARRFVCAAIAAGPRKMIHAVRVLDEMLDLQEINELASKMWERMLADIVVVQGSSKERRQSSLEAITIAQGGMHGRD